MSMKIVSFVVSQFLLPPFFWYRQTREEEQIVLESDGQQSMVTIRIPFNMWQIISSPNPRLVVQRSSPKFESSQVILLIKNDKRRVITNFMEGLGIEVLAVKQWDQPPLTLHTGMKNVKRGKSESNSAPNSLSLSQTSSNGDKDNTPSAQDKRNCLFSFKKINSGNSPGFELLVIDENAEPFQEIRKIISDFKRDLQISHCRAVWLKRALSRSIDHKDYDLNRNDVITITKPFHSGRLSDLIKLLAKFGGLIENIENDKSTSSSKEKSKPSSENSRMNSFSSSHSGNYTQDDEIQEEWTDKPLIQKKRD